MRLATGLLVTQAIHLRAPRRATLSLALLILPFMPPAPSSLAAEIPQDANAKIAFASNRQEFHGQIYIMNPDGSNQTRVTNNPNYESGPSLSPNADKIAFVRHVPEGGDFVFRIYTINSDGTGETPLTSEYAFRPSFSPDGSKILFLSGRAADNYTNQIYLMNADGSNQLNVSQNSAENDYDPSFSPDGSKIVFSSAYRVSQFVAYQRIFVMNADGSNRRMLTAHPPNQFWGDRRPAFSPDGTKIVFETTSGGGSGYGIGMVNADGTGQTILHYQIDDSRPSFSPDGNKIVFQQYSTVGDSSDQISTMNLDGSDVQNISNNGLHDSEPSWAPGPTTADLSILSVTDSPDPVSPNGDVRYRITIRNSGPDTARYVRTAVTVVNGTLIRSDLPYMYANGVFTFVRALVYNAEDFHFDVVISANQPPPEQAQTVQLSAVVSSNASDPFSANNTGAATTSIVPPPPSPPPGALGATPFVVNESLDPGPNLAETVLVFAAGQPSRAAGFNLRVQQTTSPNDEGSWTTLPEGGRMMLEANTFNDEDESSVQIYSLNTTSYLNANGVYFRAIASAPGHPDSVSNVVPDPLMRPGLNLESNKPRLRPTVFRIAGLEVPRRILPGQKMPFLAVQPDFQAQGLQVRVQTSTSPRDEQSWRTLPDSVMTTSCTADVDPNFCSPSGTTNFFHVRSNAYQTGDVYFRAISSAPGYLDSISKAIGPFQLTYDEPPVVLLTPPSLVNHTSRPKDGIETPEVIFVTVDATDPDGTVQKVTLYVDGRPFLIKDAPPWVFNIESLQPGRHSLDAVAWDERGGPGFSNHVGDYLASNTGGFTFNRIADGAWNEATAWQPTGVPGPNDTAKIYDRTVDLNGATVALTSLDLTGGRINGPGTLSAGFAKIGGAGSGAAVVITTLDNLTFNVPTNEGLLFVDSPTSRSDGTIPGLVRFDSVTVNNHGRAILTGNQFEGRTSTLFNYGTSTFGSQLRNGSLGRPSAATLGMVENHGTLDLSGGVLQANQLVQINGQLITGASIVGAGGGNVISNDGAGIVGAGGLNVISNDGAGLIGNDGASLIGLDGASLIGSHAASLIGQDGAGIVAGGGMNRPGLNGSRQRTSTEPLVRIAGGIVTGNGLIAGDVENSAGTIRVGNSPGAIAIEGAYMQGPNASLVLDFSGRNGLAGQYDLLKISGDANLSGTLAITPVPGATPGETAIVPLAYQSVVGGLSVPGSNAQITFNTTGAIVTVQPSTPLDLVSVVSRKTHGAAGNFDINVPLTGAPAVECRTGGANGNHTLVFTFSAALAGGNAAVTSGTGSVLGTPAISGSTMTVNLTGVADIQRMTVTLSGVTGSASQVLPDTPANVNFLLGDTTGNGAVGSSDIAQTKSQSGTPVTASNFRSDVNMSGTMTATDIAQVKSNSGHTLP